MNSGQSLHSPQTFAKSQQDRVDRRGGFGSRRSNARTHQHGGILEITGDPRSIVNKLVELFGPPSDPSVLQQVYETLREASDMAYAAYTPAPAPAEQTSAPTFANYHGVSVEGIGVHQKSFIEDVERQVLEHVTMRECIGNMLNAVAQCINGMCNQFAQQTGILRTNTAVVINIDSTGTNRWHVVDSLAPDGVAQIAGEGNFFLRFSDTGNPAAYYIKDGLAFSISLPGGELSSAPANAYKLLHEALHDCTDKWTAGLLADIKRHILSK